MHPLICPMCLTVVIADTAPAIGQPIPCPCLDRPPYTRPVHLMLLRIPKEFELRRIEPAT